MSLPKWATTVTPLSKNLALVLFIILPILGFFFGIRYQQMKTLPEGSLLIQANNNLPTETPMKPTTQSIEPAITGNASNWKSYSATDPEFGVKTKILLPEGYSFNFDSGFWIDNADYSEQWHYYTSVNNGKNGLQNYYDGASLLDWYERRLNGEFVTEGEYPKKSGEILSSSNHPIGKQSYLEIKVKEYTGNVEMHYVYLQNGIVHIILPATKPINPNSLISKNIGLIFTSLSSSVFKVRL